LKRWRGILGLILVGLGVAYFATTPADRGISPDEALTLLVVCVGGLLLILDMHEMDKVNEC
jgi:hypothetical protein